MSKHEDTARLVDDLVRLRRIQRDLPDSEDVQIVIADLEHRLGPAVRRSVAARMLGVSEPTVQRRIDGGDLPAVFNDRLKYEVPVGPLVQLLGEVDDYRREHPDDPQPVVAVFADRRERANRTRARLQRQLKKWHFDPAADPHRRAEIRNRAMHWLLAEHLDRALVRQARARLLEWERREAIHPVYAQRWRDVLSRPLADVRKIMTADDPESRDLRQSSPFAGALLERERLQVLELVR